VAGVGFDLRPSGYEPESGVSAYQAKRAKACSDAIVVSRRFVPDSPIAPFRVASRLRKWGHPMACILASSGGRSRCSSCSLVPSAVGSRVSRRRKRPSKDDHAS
jgi:hypothetical protein